MDSLIHSYFVALLIITCIEILSVDAGVAQPPVIRNSSSGPKPCDVESKCVVDAKTEPVCRYDEEEGCIRKYDSLCHLKIAACKDGKEYTDYNNDYCYMDTFLCEEGYERWTIYFGYEKE